MARRHLHLLSGRPFVQFPCDIAGNVAVLHAACMDPSDGGEYARAVLRRGANYVAAIVDDRLSFAPSRFAGYLGNTLHAHQVDLEKHGSRTDGRISTVLGTRPVASNELEALFHQYCQDVEVAVSGKERTYWRLDGRFWSSDGGDQQASDVADLLKRKRAIGTTQLKRLVDARLGQGAYRSALLRRFGDKCAVSGCAVTQILRASHCKPWSKSSDDERLNEANGLLLEARLDALFDRALISFERNGTMVVSRRVNDAERKRLCLNGARLRCRPDDDQWAFLSFHLSAFRAVEQLDVSTRCAAPAELLCC